MNAKVKNFKEMMQVTGHVTFFGFIKDQKLLNNAKEVLEKANVFCRNIQRKNGVKNSENTVHHLLHQHPIFMDLLGEFRQLDDFLQEFFKGKYILNSYGGNLLSKDSSYASEVHRDIRTFSGDLPLMLNTIVMLDDFTEANGATRVLPGSHHLENKPSKDFFDNYSMPLTASAGSVVVFNSNLWHAAGVNKTKHPRRSVTPMFSKPFMKPQFDYCRAMKKTEASLSPYMRQLVGYNARIPSTLSEWYQLPENRFYKGDQG